VLTYDMVNVLQKKSWQVHCFENVEKYVDGIIFQFKIIFLAF